MLTFNEQVNFQSKLNKGEEDLSLAIFVIDCSTTCLVKKIGFDAKIADIENKRYIRCKKNWQMKVTYGFSIANEQKA